jgi:hypothetical protein
MNLSRKLLVAALGVGLAACGGKSESPSGGGAAGPTAAAAKPAEVKAPAGPVVDRFRIGRTYAADGSVTDETDTFSQGETILISFELKGAPPGAVAKVVWTTDGGKKILGEEQKTPASETGLVSFSAKETAAWPAGEYYVLMQVGDGTGKSFSGLGGKDFRIVAKRTGTR